MQFIGFDPLESDLTPKMKITKLIAIKCPGRLRRRRHIGGMGRLEPESTGYSRPSSVKAWPD